MNATKDWISCPKCRRRIFRWTGDGIEVAPGAKVWHPIIPTATERGADQVSRAECPRGHMAGPPQEWPFD